MSEDLHAARERLAGVPGVADATVASTPGGMSCIEIVLQPRYDTLGGIHLDAIADEGLGIVDVSRQGNPTHLFVTVR